MRLDGHSVLAKEDFRLQLNVVECTVIAVSDPIIQDGDHGAETTLPSHDGLSRFFDDADELLQKLRSMSATMDGSSRHAIMTVDHGYSFFKYSQHHQCPGVNSVQSQSHARQRAMVRGS